MIHYITTNGIGNAWVAAELRIMERKGVPFRLHSLRAPHQNFFGSSWADDLNRRTRLLYPLPRAAFVLSLLLAPLLFGRNWFAALANALLGERESWRNRLASLAHFALACHWARQLRREEVSGIHAQWIHSAGTVAMYGAWLLGVPFSWTGHAADLFRERVALRDKIRRARFIVCISEFHRQLYLREGARPEQLHTVYCGIEVGDFRFVPRDGAKPGMEILSVGRLVEKKGFHVLIDACRLLADRGVPFTCRIVGDGPMTAALREQLGKLGLEGRVVVTGKAVLQEELPALMAAADVYAQPCVWAADNDVDGTPRTLLEAMACGTPSVATRLVGIPDMIDDGISGLLVEPEDAEGLALALHFLLTNPGEAARLGRGGRRAVETKFDIDHCLEPLADLFRPLLVQKSEKREHEPALTGAGEEAPR